MAPSLFRSLFGSFDFEDFFTRRTQQHEFEWLRFDSKAALDAIFGLDRPDDVERLVASFGRDSFLMDDKEPYETEEFLTAFTEAELRFREKSYEKALHLYAKAQIAQPLISKTYLKLAVTFMKLERYESAVACSIAAFMAEPHDVESESMHAMAYSKLGYTDIGNKFISENPHNEESTFLKTLLKGMPQESRRRFDDDDLKATLQLLVGCAENQEDAALRLFFLLHHVRYQQWLQPRSQLISPAIIKFLSENQLVSTLCASAVSDFKAMKQVATCVLFALFSLLAELCRHDEQISLNLWSSPAVRMFLSKMATQITREKVITEVVTNLGIFGRAVVITFIDLMSALAQHEKVRHVMCRHPPFDHVLWFGLAQMVYYRLGSHELFQHEGYVEHSLPVLCFACTNGKAVLNTIENYFDQVELPPHDFFAQFIPILPKLVESKEIMKTLETYSIHGLEYVTHVFSILSAIAFYAKMDEYRVNKFCSFMTPFWLKLASSPRIANGCSSGVWYFFARKLSMYWSQNEVFKSFKPELAQTLDVLVKLSAVDDFHDIKGIDRALGLLAQSVPSLVNCKTAPSSTPAIFLKEISCKALMLLIHLNSRSPLFTSCLLGNRGFSLWNLVEMATPASQRGDPSPVCFLSLQLLTILLKKSPEKVTAKLLSIADFVKALITDLAVCLSKTKNIDFITTACLFMKTLTDSKNVQCQNLVVAGLKASWDVDQRLPWSMMTKLFSLIDSNPAIAKAVHDKQKSSIVFVLTVALFFASLVQIDSQFCSVITSTFSVSKKKTAITRISSLLSTDLRL